MKFFGFFLFDSAVAFLYPLKSEKGFPMFSGGIERQHQAAMG